MNVDFTKLSQIETATAHGVTVRTLLRWTRRGFPRNADGSYDLTATIRFRLAYWDSYRREIDWWRVKRDQARA